AAPGKEHVHDLIPNLAGGRLDNDRAGPVVPRAVMARRAVFAEPAETIGQFNRTEATVIIVVIRVAAHACATSFDLTDEAHEHLVATAGQAIVGDVAES